MKLDVCLLVAAIWTAEGGSATRHPYGVRSVQPRDGAHARQICIQTVQHAWRDWTGQGCFVVFLADRYCPAATDPTGNRNWKRNVARLTGHARCDCVKDRKQIPWNRKPTAPVPRRLPGPSFRR